MHMGPKTYGHCPMYGLKMPAKYWDPVSIYWAAGSTEGLGDTVIGHGIGGKVSQLKWHDSLKASRWSKRRRSVLVTQSHSQSTSDGSEDPLTLTPYIIGDSLRRISTTSPIEVSYELLRYHGIGSRT